jgi:hypothetical protein
MAFQLAQLDGDWEEATRLHDAAVEMDLRSHLSDLLPSVR